MTRPTPPLKEVRAWAAFDGEHLLPKTVRTTRRESIESAVVGGGFGAHIERPATPSAKCWCR